MVLFELSAPVVALEFEVIEGRNWDFALHQY